MKQKNISLKKNFLMNVLLSMSSFIFPLIAFPYVSRILGPEGMGKVSFAASFISYFSMFAQLGIPTYGIRACAKVRDNREELTRTSQELLIINLTMDIFSYFALFICLISVPKLREDRTLYVIVSSTILLTSIGMEWLYKALEQYSYITIRSIIFKALAFAAMFLLIHNKEDYVIYGGISIFASSASNVLNFINVHKYIDLKPAGKYNFRQHIKPILIFFAMTAAATVYTNLDTVMLGFMKTNEEVGYYNTAVKIKSVLVSLVTSLGTVLLPRVSYYIGNGDEKDFYKISKKALNFVFIIAVPLFIYFEIFAKEGIYLLSGEAYESSIIPMKIIMPTVLFIGLSNLIGIQILVPLGEEDVVLNSVVLGAIIDLIINALLIPKYASSGAAVGTLIAEFVVLCFQYFRTDEFIKKYIKNISYWKILISVTVSSLCSVWVKLLNTGNFITLLSSAVLFFISYFVMLILTRESIAIYIMNLVVEKMRKRKT